MAKYRKKPVVVDAIRFTGENGVDLYAFCKTTIYDQGVPIIPTLEGKMKVDIGDYVIKGIKGEYYPCKPDIFEATYEKVE